MFFFYVLLLAFGSFSSTNSNLDMLDVLHIYISRSLSDLALVTMASTRSV